jgi:hypothetical protein
MLFAGWVIGVLMGGAAAFVLLRIRPALLGRPSGSSAIPVFDDPSGPPAVNPADPNLPDSVDATQVAKIERIPHAQLRELARSLKTWKPRRHRDEAGYQRSFAAHLLKSGYAQEDVTRHPRLRWTAEDRDPDSDDKHAVPDFSVKRVLVEIKRDVTSSSHSDRALGQMSRYCIAWRREGPALLVVCNDYDPGLRTFVNRTVRGWKAQGVPVVAYFVRASAGDVGADDEFPAGTFRNEVQA